MINQLIRFSTLMLLVAFSCASRKTRLAERHERVQSANLALLHDTASHALRFSAVREREGTLYRDAAIITPSEVFSYHPDSGFRGRAARVELRREGLRIAERATRDSLSTANLSTIMVANSVGTTETQTIDSRDVHHTPWRWVAIALAFAAIGLFFLWRIFR